MTRTMTITQVKAKLLALVDEVQSGDEIIITRHGAPVARLTPTVGSQTIKGMYAGIVRTVATDEELYGSGEDWESS